MPDKILMEIIEKASSDKEFRQLLFNNSAEALKSYDLTAEARAALENLDEASFDAFAGSLGGRTTKAMWRPGG